LGSLDKALAGAHHGDFNTAAEGIVKLTGTWRVHVLK